MSSIKADNKVSGQTLPARLWAFVVSWLLSQTLLFEAFLVALALHVLLVPVLWVIGWALPWPKGPTITTVVEYDLRDWPNLTKSKKVLEFRNPEHNQ